MRIIVVAVGRLRPPYADDVQHYQKLLARHARLELVEVREDEQVARRLPERAFVSLLERDGQELPGFDPNTGFFNAQVGGPETQFQAGRVVNGQAQMMGCRPIPSVPRSM